MKVSDLVRWRSPRFTESELADADADTGVVVDGPRINPGAPTRTISYKVAWFAAKETFWHNDYNLELISESR